MKKWKCLVCGYMHEGDEPPDICPVCSVGPDQFEQVFEEKAADRGNKKTYVIVGSGIAAVSAAENLRQLQPEAKIRIFTQETEFPVWRMNLSRWLAGELNDQQIELKARDWWANNNIELNLRQKVTSLDIPNKKIKIENDTVVSWDCLLLATGASAFVPPVEGTGFSNVCTFRTLEDGFKLKKMAESGRRAVCIGGGLLGLETAGALSRLGVKVTVVEMSDYLLSRQLNQAAAEVFEVYCLKQGLKLVKSAISRRFAGSELAEKLVLEDGRELEADFFCNFRWNSQ